MKNENKTEMKMKHTKGNWKIADKAMNRLLLTVGDYESCAIDVWGGLYGFPTIEEAEANAKLIAAAPDLLEALSNVMRHFADVTHGNCQGFNVVTLNDFAEARKAIKKATE